MVKVEVLVRDVSEGKLAKIKKFVKIFYPRNIRNEDAILYHVGIRIYGGGYADTIYEYTAGGIEAKSIENVSEDEGYMLLENGLYEKTEEEINKFIVWMKSPSVQMKFNQSTYDIPLNNCIHFFKDACVILGIQFPTEFEGLLEFIKQFPPTLVRLVGGEFGGSVSKASGSGAN